MGADFRPPSADLRRNEALAFIIQRIVQTGTSPSSLDIGRALDVSRTRAQQLVDQLIAGNILARTPGSRSLRIVNMKYCRHIIMESLRGLGLIVAEPMGELQTPLSLSQLPQLPPFEHLPDPD